MDIRTVEFRVEDIIREVVGLGSADPINPDAQIVRDLGADSLDQVELGYALEEAFGIEVSDDDMVKLVTFSDIVNHVSSALEKKRP